MHPKFRNLCWLSLIAAGESAALGLGEMTVHSSLGERFRAEVQLLERPGDEPARSECFRLIPPENHDLPTLGKATLAIERRGAEKRLLIVSHQSVSDPVLQLALRVGCGTEITRNYSLFIDPSVVAGQRAATDKPQRTPAAAAHRPPDGARWSTGEGESLRSMAATLFPGQPGAQQRFMQAVRAANPDLDFGAQGRNVLLPGTQLAVPAMRPAAPAFAGSGTPAARQKADPAASAPRSSPQPAAKINPPRAASSAKRSGDRLLLSDTLDEAHAASDELRLRLATDLSGATARFSGESQRALLRVEYQLLTSLNEQAHRQLGLVEQIRLLEASLAALQPLAADVGREAATGVPQISLPVAAVAQPSPPPPITKIDPHPAQTTPSPLSALDWLLLLAGAIGVVAVLVWFMQRRSRPAAPESVASVGYPAAAPSPPDDFASPQAADGDDFASPAPAKNRDRLSPPDDRDASITESMAPLSRFSQEPAALIEDSTQPENPEFNPVMELAEVMLSFGRIKGATQALQEYIDQNPTESLHPWMKLLEIYRQNNMRDDFEQYSEKLPLRFNVARIDWDSPLLLQQSPIVEPGDESAALEELFKRLPNLAALPHIVERIARTWGSEECAEYLRTLLRDNRNGERIGFSLAVVQELLFLSNFVEKHLKAPA